MKYYVKENTSKSDAGFYVVPDDEHYSLGELIASEVTWTSITGHAHPFKNHKTAREAISHLRQVVGKKLRRLPLVEANPYGFKTRYVYSD